MKLIPCALELIQETRAVPKEIAKTGETFYRFYGVTKNNQSFVVQIKENSKKQKYLMSVFPEK